MASAFKDILWSFNAFLIIKSLSILSGLPFYVFGWENINVMNTSSPIINLQGVSVVCSVISNVFLFHFGISMLTYKTTPRFNYKIFPVILFVLYICLVLSGVIKIETAEQVSRHSLGFNGAFLGSIGCLNLLNLSKRHLTEKRVLPGLYFSGIALLLYAVTEGIIVQPVFGIRVEFLRFFSALALLFPSIFLIELLKEEPKERIGFI
jgi:hypothetical protein